MANPIARVAGNSVVMSTVAVNRAVDAQAKITGGASNFALQASLQSVRIAEDRRKAAHDLISLKSINAAQAALPTLRNMKRSDQEDEEEHDDPRHPRRQRRRAGHGGPGPAPFR